MKRVAPLALVLLAALPAASVESARPPYLLTYSLQHQHRGSWPAGGRGLCIARSDGSRPLRLTAPRDDRMSAWSPDGKLVAFVRQYGDDRVFEVLLADTRGRVIRNLSGNSQTFDVEPAWSPDGRWLAYDRWYDGSRIYLVRRDGMRHHKFPAGPGFTSHPAWSPDGRFIAYTSYALAPPSAIYVARIDGTEQRLLLPNAATPAWSPDGTKLAFTRKSGDLNEIWIANADGTDASVLVSSPERKGKPAWSPDGRLIAFDRSELDYTTDRNSIVVVDSQTGEQRSTFRRRWGVHDPSWRPARTLPPARRAACR